jgi:hypothetical protein
MIPQNHNYSKNNYNSKINNNNNNKVQNVSKNISTFVNIKPSTGSNYNHNKSNSIVYKNNTPLPIKDSPILMKLI